MNENKQFIFLLCLIIFHVYVVIGNLLAFFIVPFLCPWYVALPICSLIVTLSFGRGSDCPLTRLENKIRKNKILINVRSEKQKRNVLIVKG